MATSYSPKIITDGLIFCLDAGHPRCFQSGQTTATDLVQGFNCSGASGTPNAGTHTPNTANFPAYSSSYGGVFDFNGGRGINVDGDLGSSTASSIGMWIYKTSAATEYITDGRNNGGQWFLSNYTSFNYNWHDTLRYNYDATYNGATDVFINKWIYMVATSDSTGSKLYLNGQPVSSTYENSADEDFGINYRIGTRYTTSGQWGGLMGPIHFYNKRLSDAEVLQNYNATKGRFGL
jgi:hypothetical protein